MTLHCSFYDTSVLITWTVVAVIHYCVLFQIKRNDYVPMPRVKFRLSFRFKTPDGNVLLYLTNVSSSDVRSLIFPSAGIYMSLGHRMIAGLSHFPHILSFCFLYIELYSWILQISVKSADFQNWAP